MCIVACGFGIPAGAQISNDELRHTAEQILSGDEYQHFDHFERKPAISESASNQVAPADGTKPVPKPWWDRVRKRDAKPAPKPIDESQAAPETSEKNEQVATSPTAGHEKPRDQRPAQRGSDGVERPVRHAQRAQHAPPEWKFPLPEWLLALFEPFAHVFGLALHGVAYLVLAAIVVLIIALAARAFGVAWQHRRRGGNGGAAWLSPLAHDRSPGETAADVYLQNALTLAGHGAYREALGQLLLGAMSCIERHDWIRYRRGLTIRDYLRSVRSHPEQHAGLKQVVAVYEPAEYGRMAVTQSEFETALVGYRQGFDIVSPGTQR